MDMTYEEGTGVVKFITMTCRDCESRLKVKPCRASQYIDCPKCGRMLRVRGWLETPKTPTALDEAAPELPDILLALKGDPFWKRLGTGLGAVATWIARTVYRCRVAIGLSLVAILSVAILCLMVYGMTKVDAKVYRTIAAALVMVVGYGLLICAILAPSAVVGYFIGYTKGRGITGAKLGFWLGPIGWLFAIGLKERQETR